jgi:hypothetical protein
MKKFVAIAVAVVALLAWAMIYNVWRGSQEPVTRTPGPLENGRAQLRRQLDDAQKTEALVEKQDWDSAVALRSLINGHKQRIDKLKGNTEAGEIVAYDQAATERLEKRIADLAAQEAARAAEPQAESQANPARDAQP